jgi:RHS repeat-associated protein
MGSVTANGSNQISGFTYDASGNTLNDGTIAYAYDAESQIKTAAGVTYLYDGSGRRVSKSNGKLYWYGSGGEILAETDASGNTLNEYIFFAGKRVAMLPAGGNVQLYAEDLLGTSRVIASSTGTVCYDADLDPYGGEHAFTNNCPTSNNYKFEGKERDTETGNDDFGARYYSSHFGRWLSADWSSVPVAVPYANLTNPQTLNLYAMVADDPETSADLDGHASVTGSSHEDCSYLESHCGQAAIQDLMNSESTTDADAAQTKAANQQSAASQNANQQAQGQDQGKKCGFFCRMGHGLSNLFHGHSWNYINATVTTVVVESHVEREPNESVTATADVINLAAAATETVPLGAFGAIASIKNDPSTTNKATNLLGLVRGFDWPMAITGTFNDWLSWGTNNSTPGTKKVYDNHELQHTLPTQDAGCEAAGLPAC